MGLRLLEQARHVTEIVLTIRIQLQGMAEPRRPRGHEAAHHGGALAPVLGVAQQGEPVPVLPRQGIQGGGGDGFAAIVDQQAGQPHGLEAGQHPGQGARMVVTGDDDAGRQGHRATRPLLTCSPATL